MICCDLKASQKASQFFSQEPAKPDKPYWLVAWLAYWLSLGSWLSVGWLA
jgi:hypothetical protein